MARTEINAPLNEGRENWHSQTISRLFHEGNFALISYNKVNLTTSYHITYNYGSLILI